MLSSRVPDPVQKLRFIKRTLDAFQSKPESLRRFPVLRDIVFHYVALESLGELLGRRHGARVALPRAPIWALYYLRHLVFATAVFTVGYGAFHLGASGYGAARFGADWLFERLIAPPVAVSSPPLDYPAMRIGAAPEDIWLVDEDAEEELWSNGLRIVTTFETSGEPRFFFAFPRDDSPPVPMGPRPVGIVYHATQSDMAPLAPQFNRDILTTTRDLVGWLSRREIYHYVIDRFGQVYRIVPDEEVAVHAGVSIWADASYHYLNLNDSFIGVAFESQWRAGSEVITQAQLQAAANLTDLLRARYGIVDANCVPHGLVSVNPTKKLIGYHADWARDFPFAALGLSDKYQVPPPSIVAFGFGHDEDLRQRLGGKLWPGVALAERELDERAAQEGISVSELRARLQRRYRDNVAIIKLERRASAKAARSASRSN